MYTTTTDNTNKTIIMTMKNNIGYTPIRRDIVIEFKEKTESGIHLPESVTNTLDEDKPFEIVAVGPECTQAKVGSKVYLRSVQPALVKHNGKRYFQFNEGDILGFVN